MDFIVVGRWEEPPPVPRPLVLLRRNNWDDYSLKTLFGVELYLESEEIDLGSVKIMRQGQLEGYTSLPDSFHRLDASYCSLGQEVEYYESLMRVRSSLRDDYLRSIRDAVADPSIEALFENEPAWGTSLLRFGQAANALAVGRELLQGRRRRHGVAGFTFERPGSANIDFRFDDTSPLPGRTNVIIGYNGVGKTRLLADIANTVSKVNRGSGHPNDEGRLSGNDQTFAAVIAVSYSAFDHFALPMLPAQQVSAKQDSRTEAFGYVYCGLRRIEAVEIPERTAHSAHAEVGKIRGHHLKNLDEIDAEFLGALSDARQRDGGDRIAVSTALELLEREPSFGRIGISPSAWVADPDQADAEIEKLSTGHKIVLNIVVQLAAHLRRRSLVLLDEPETHLHPPLLAALLKAIQRLLEHYDSFAIMATHSPVALQEVPANSVQVLSRFGDFSEVSPPEIETFGENLSAITRNVFSLDSSATDFQGVLVDLAATMSLEEIDRLFPFGLSDQARALVLRLKRATS